jgi:DNA mismatch endonuclease (patch repair protein)
VGTVVRSPPAATLSSMGPRDSWASSDTARRIMQGNKSRDTKPELAIRKAVHAMGLRYRVNVQPLPAVRRTADLVFPREKVAVMVDGCYWHGCPEHHTSSKSNQAYWLHKIAENRERDLDTDARFADAGWHVIRIWEHVDPLAAAQTIKDAVVAHRA